MSDWVDVNGNPWRFSSMTSTWQTQTSDGSWVTAPLPSGGLTRTDTFTSSGDVVIVETMGPPGPPGPPGASGPPGVGGLAVAEVIPPEYQDGVNDTFPLSVSADLSQAVQVFRNGLMEMPGHGYLVTPTHVTFTTPPLDSDVLTVVYQKAQ